MGNIGVTDDRAAFAPPRERPNRLVSLLFCLVLGVLSIVFAEVVSGSSRFPFLNPGGWLITYPVYLLHTVFLAGILVRIRRTSWRSLLFAGAIFALYEAYIMKVLWDPFWSPEFALMFAGISWSHFVMLITWWHPLMAFAFPILLAEMFLVKDPVFLAGLPGWLKERLAASRSRKRLVAVVLVFFGVCSVAGQPPWLGLVALVSHGVLILFLFWLWRKANLHQRFSIEALLPGRVGLAVCAILLAALYGLATPTIMPERLPGPMGHITVIALYALFIAFIALDRPVASRVPDPALSRYPLASLRPLWLAISFALLAGLPFALLGRFTVFIYLVHWWIVSPVCGLPLYLTAFVCAFRSRTNSRADSVNTMCL